MSGKMLFFEGIYIPRTVRCEAAFVIPGAANQQLAPKAMHKTWRRKV